MIRPLRCSFMYGTTARLIRKTPVRSMRSISSQVETGNSSTVLRSAAFTPIPALLTRMSIRPVARATAATVLSNWSPSPTSKT
jgi:hypothetical protein